MMLGCIPAQTRSVAAGGDLDIGDLGAASLAGVFFVGKHRTAAQWPDHGVDGSEP